MEREQALALLDELKATVSEIVRISTANSGAPLTDEIPTVHRLLQTVEKILNFGLKDIAFIGTTVFWDYLVNIEECIPEGEKVVKDIKNLAHSDLARGRLFIRYALNNQCLHTYLEVLLWNAQLTRKYYVPFAILAREEFQSVLTMLLENLKSVQFKLSLQERGQGNSNYWDNLFGSVLASITSTEVRQQPTSTPAPTQSTPQVEHTTQNPVNETQPSSAKSPSHQLPTSPYGTENTHQADQMENVIPVKRKLRTKGRKKPHLVKLDDPIHATEKPQTTVISATTNTMNHEVVSEEFRSKSDAQDIKLAEHVESVDRARAEVTEIHTFSNQNDEQMLSSASVFDLSVPESKESKESQVIPNLEPASQDNNSEGSNQIDSQVEKDLSSNPSSPSNEESSVTSDAFFQQVPQSDPTAVTIIGDNEPKVSSITKDVTMKDMQHEHLGGDSQSEPVMPEPTQESINTESEVHEVGTDDTALATVVNTLADSGDMGHDNINTDPSEDTNKPLPTVDVESSTANEIDSPNTLSSKTDVTVIDSEDLTLSTVEKLVDATLESLNLQSTSSVSPLADSGTSASSALESSLAVAESGSQTPVVEISDEEDNVPNSSDESTPVTNVESTQSNSNTSSGSGSATAASYSDVLKILSQYDSDHQHATLLRNLVSQVDALIQSRAADHFVAYLNESIDLLLCLELTLCDGIKLSNEDIRTDPAAGLWPWFARLNDVLPTQSGESIVDLVRRTQMSTSQGLARAFIHAALSRKDLSINLQALAWLPSISDIFEPTALVRNESLMALLVLIVKEMQRVEFRLPLSDPDMDLPHYYELRKNAQSSQHGGMISRSNSQLNAAGKKRKPKKRIIMDMDTYSPASKRAEEEKLHAAEPTEKTEISVENKESDERIETQHTPQPEVFRSDVSTSTSPSSLPPSVMSITTVVNEPPQMKLSLEMSVSPSESSPSTPIFVPPASPNLKDLNSKPDSNNSAPLSATATDTEPSSDKAMPIPIRSAAISKLQSDLNDSEVPVGSLSRSLGRHRSRSAGSRHSPFISDSINTSDWSVQQPTPTQPSVDDSALSRSPYVPKISDFDFVTKLRRVKNLNSPPDLSTSTATPISLGFTFNSPPTLSSPKSSPNIAVSNISGVPIGRMPSRFRGMQYDGSRTVDISSLRASANFTYSTPVGTFSPAYSSGNTHVHDAFNPSSDYNDFVAIESSSPPSSHDTPTHILTHPIYWDYTPMPERRTLRVRMTTKHPKLVTIKEPELELESQQEKLQNVPVHYHLSLEDIPRKPFTDKNKYCAGCGVELTKSLISTPRYCYYTSNYYCKKCHMNSTSILPAKVVKNWDFRKYSVCTFAKNHIDANFMAPLIDILATNPKLLDWVPALKRILKLREKLVCVGEYIRSCRNSQKLLTRMEGQTHFLVSKSLFSLNDLVMVNDGQLEKILQQVFDEYVLHITSCDICKGKAFVCEICNSNQLLFAFQENVVQCPNCKSVFHAQCFAPEQPTKKSWRKKSPPPKPKPECPKCKRIAALRRSSIERLESKQSDQSTSM